MDKTKSVAILYICTGQYDVFWKDFYDSYEEYFLINSHKEYFVFTDASNLYKKGEDNVHIIYQESLGWPNNTLMRYHMFNRILNQLEKFDYIFFMNANCKCTALITEEEFLPEENQLLVVQHPGFYNKTNDQFTYDRNPESTAYIPMGEGKYYICGGVNGGESKVFIQLIKDIIQCVDIDHEHDVIALWHDESHINKYIQSHTNYRILTPAYCYPEGWKLPFECKILIRDKKKWINVNKVKNTGIINKIKDIFKNR